MMLLWAKAIFGSLWYRIPKGRRGGCLYSALKLHVIVPYRVSKTTTDFFKTNWD